MDKIKKTLEKLSAKDKAAVKTILIKLHASQLLGMNIQKLRGHTDIFRIRKGNLRIIFRKEGADIFILGIEKRSEKTYRDF
ncbi:MAG: hypothetical protein KBD66_02755 [Candidatus Doudnabacteria bacterium]|nr:hypothetical protein [Candidatus Doudnabacteria bacterium]